MPPTKSSPAAARRAASPAVVTRMSARGTAAAATKPMLSDTLKECLAPLTFLNWRDPTFLFLTNTYLSVLFIEADDKSKTLTLSMPTATQALGHFFDPAVFIGLLECTPCPAQLHWCVPCASLTN